MRHMHGVSDRSVPDRILETARLAFLEDGYADTTMVRVAKGAGVSKDRLYAHFASKDELMRSILLVKIGQLRPLFVSAAAEAVSAEELADRLVAGLKDLLDDDPDYFHLLLVGVAVCRHCTMVRTALEDCFRMLVTVLRDSMLHLELSGALSPRVPIESMPALIAGYLEGVGLHYSVFNSADKADWDCVRDGLVALMT